MRIVNKSNVGVWITCFIVGFSCQSKKSIPIPQNTSGYLEPETVPFKFPEVQPIQWKEVPSDSLPTKKTLSFDFNQLPSQPFSIHDFKPLARPLDSIPLNFDQLEPVSLDLDTIPGTSLRMTSTLVPNPTISRLNIPTIWSGTTAGIVKMGQSEGLIGSRVNALVTDKTGTVWIATTEGIARYIGDRFEVFDILKKLPNGFLENPRDIKIDSHGKNLLIGTSSGILRFNITTRILERYETDIDIIRIFEDHTGLIWVSSFTGGSHYLDPKTQTLHQFLVPLEEGERPSSAGVYEDSQHNLWVASRQRIEIINSTRTEIRVIGANEGLTTNIPYEFREDADGTIWISSYSNDQKAISLKKDKIITLGNAQGFYGRSRGVMIDRLNRYWIINQDTLYVLDPARSSLKKIPNASTLPGNDYPSDVMISDKGVLWFGTAGEGLLFVNPMGMLSEHFDMGDGLVDDNIWGILEDKNGRVWMSSHNGLNVYDPQEERIYLIDIPEDMGFNNHRGISHIDEDRMLISSLGGFIVVDIPDQTMTVYSVPTMERSAFFDGMADQEGVFWFGSPQGLYSYDPSTNRMVYLDESAGLASNTVWMTEQGPKGNIWVITTEGVNIIDPKEHTLMHLNEQSGLRSNATWFVTRTSKDEMVIGGRRGISIIESAQVTITHLDSKNGMSPENVYDIAELNGRLHIGSENGIIVIDRPENTGTPFWRFTNFGRAEGYEYNDYNQGTATTTHDGIVWWSASPQLNVNLQDPIIDSVSPEVHITAFNIMDQQPTYVSNELIKSELNSDTLWSSEGYDFYLKDQFPKDSGYLVINNITWDSITAGFQLPVGLKLPYEQNSVNFSFANLDILGRDKLVYRYVLEGADEEWSEISDEPSSRIYYNLRPGAYSFKVITSGFNGVWSSPASVDFTILPPWWETWWAYTLMGIAFIGAIRGYTFFRSKVLKRQNQLLEEKVKIRTQALNKSIEDLKSTQSQLIHSEKMASLGELTAGIAHEIQNPLNFVNNFSDLNKELIEELKEAVAQNDQEEVDAILEDLRGNEDKVIYHGKRAEQIVKSMLQHSRGSEGDKVPTDINALADEYLRLSYHGLRAKDRSFNADFNMEADEGLPKVDVVPQDLGRVLLNLINNAFHAASSNPSPPEPVQGDGEANPIPLRSPQGDNKPLVVVKTQKLENSIIISVSDNGPGIPDDIKEKIFQPFFTTKPTGEGTGLGLSMSYEIVNKGHQGTIDVESTINKGTKFIITLPLNN